MQSNCLPKKDSMHDTKRNAKFSRIANENVYDLLQPVTTLAQKKATHQFYTVE